MIRRAVMQDVEAIFRVREEAIRGLAAGHYSDRQIHAWLGTGTPRSFEAPIAGKIVLVDETESELRGFAQLDLAVGSIDRVYVSPLHARRGTGTRLLRQLEVIAREHGVARLAVEATLNAVPFYQNAGYVALETCDHELQPGITFRCVAMVKVLRE